MPPRQAASDGHPSSQSSHPAQPFRKNHSRRQKKKNAVAGTVPQRARGGETSRRYHPYRQPTSHTSPRPAATSPRNAQVSSNPGESEGSQNASHLDDHLGLAEQWWKSRIIGEMPLDICDAQDLPPTSAQPNPSMSPFAPSRPSPHTSDDVLQRDSIPIYTLAGLMDEHPDVLGGDKDQSPSPLDGARSHGTQTEAILPQIVSSKVQVTKISRKPLRSAESVLKRNRSGENRRLHRLVKEAFENIVRFTWFDLACEVLFREHKLGLADLKSTPAMDPWTIEDNKSRVGCDNEGRPVFMVVRGFCSNKGHDLFYESIVEFCKRIKLSMGSKADKNRCDKKSSYRQAAGELSGTVNIATSWHAIGHTKKSAIPSTSLCKGSHVFAQSCELLRNLSWYSEGINEVFQGLDPAQHAAHCALRAAAEKRYAFAEALQAIDPLLWSCRSIICNRATPLHPDSRDGLRSWAVLGAAGPFHGGAYLRIPRLNVRIRFSATDLIFLKGGVLEHEVEGWEGGQRISVAHFIPKSLWDEFGISLPL